MKNFFSPIIIYTATVAFLLGIIATVAVKSGIVAAAAGFGLVAWSFFTYYREQKRR